MMTFPCRARLRKISCGVFSIMVFGLLSLAVLAQSQTTRYNYDALGRLILVEDSQNGDRDFFYDPAGNRTTVSVEGDGVPAKPTGLNVTLVNPQYLIYLMEWNAVEGATHYILTLSDSASTTVTLAATNQSTMSYTRNQFPGRSVVACNEVGCSEPGFF